MASLRDHAQVHSPVHQVGVRAAEARSDFIPHKHGCFRAVRQRFHEALGDPEYHRCHRLVAHPSCHVAPPKRHQKSYYNRKKFYSVILSAVCDARGAFLSCDVGFPGRMSDSRVLKYVRAWLLRWWLCAVPHHPPSPCHLQVLPPLQVRGAVVREPWLLPLRRRRLPAALVAHGGLPES